MNEEELAEVKDIGAALSVIAREMVFIRRLLEKVIVSRPEPDAVGHLAVEVYGRSEVEVSGIVNTSS